MKSLGNYARKLKVVVLAGAMLLVPLTALAQQEVDPDHFDGDHVQIAQKARPTEHRRQVAAMRKTNSGSKSRHKARPNKHTEQKLAAAIRQ